MTTSRILWTNSEIKRVTKAAADYVHANGNVLIKTTDLDAQRIIQEAAGLPEDRTRPVNPTLGQYLRDLLRENVKDISAPKRAEVEGTILWTPEEWELLKKAIHEYVDIRGGVRLDFYKKSGAAETIQELANLPPNRRRGATPALLASFEKIANAYKTPTPAPNRGTLRIPGAHLPPRDVSSEQALPKGGTMSLSSTKADQPAPPAADSQLTAELRSVLQAVETSPGLALLEALNRFILTTMDKSLEARVAALVEKQLALQLGGPVTPPAAPAVTVSVTKSTPVPAPTMALVPESRTLEVHPLSFANPPKTSHEKVRVVVYGVRDDQKAMFSEGVPTWMHLDFISHRDASKVIRERASKARHIVALPNGSLNDLRLLRDLAREHNVEYHECNVKGMTAARTWLDSLIAKHIQEEKEKTS